MDNRLLFPHIKALSARVHHKDRAGVMFIQTDPVFVETSLLTVQMG